MLQTAPKPKVIRLPAHATPFPGQYLGSEASLQFAHGLKEWAPKLTYEDVIIIPRPSYSVGLHKDLLPLVPFCVDHNGVIRLPYPRVLYVDLEIYGDKFSDDLLVRDASVSNYFLDWLADVPETTRVVYSLRPEDQTFNPNRRFPLDVLGNPMREHAPGKWESAIWPSQLDDLESWNGMSDRRLLEFVQGAIQTSAKSARSRSGQPRTAKINKVVLELIDRMRPLIALAEAVDPATVRGLTFDQRAALGRYAKPVTSEPAAEKPTSGVDHGLNVGPPITPYQMRAMGVEAAREHGIIVEPHHVYLQGEWSVGDRLGPVGYSMALMNGDTFIIVPAGSAYVSKTSVAYDNLGHEEGYPVCDFCGHSYRDNMVCCTRRLEYLATAEGGPRRVVQAFWRDTDTDRVEGCTDPTDGYLSIAERQNFGGWMELHLMGRQDNG